MNKMIFDYINSLFADKYQDETVRKQKEELYDRMIAVFNLQKQLGMSDESAFGAAVQSVSADISNINPYSSVQNCSYNEVRPYSSSVIKAVAVAMLILWPTLSFAPLLGLSLSLSAYLMSIFISVGVGLLVFDAQRIKYPGAQDGAVLLALAVSLYVFGGITIESSLGLMILLVGVFFNVIAVKMIRRYKQSGGKIVIRPKNKLGWLIMLVTCILSVVVLYTTIFFSGMYVIENIDDLEGFEQYEYIIDVYEA